MKEPCQPGTALSEIEVKSALGRVLVRDRQLAVLVLGWVRRLTGIRVLPWIALVGLLLLLLLHRVVRVHRRPGIPRPPRQGSDYENEGNGADDERHHHDGHARCAVSGANSFVSFVDVIVPHNLPPSSAVLVKDLETRGTNESARRAQVRKMTIAGTLRPVAFC